jgi:acyl-CoA oxidase
VLKRTAAETIIQTILDTRQDNEEEGSLFNRGTQVKMFEDREEYMIATVARRLQGKSKEMSPFDAFNAVQDHVRTLRSAHRTNHSRGVRAGIDAAKIRRLREILNMVVRPVRAVRVEEDRAWCRTSLRPPSAPRR